MRMKRGRKGQICGREQTDSVKDGKGLEDYDMQAKIKEAKRIAAQ